MGLWSATTTSWNTPGPHIRNLPFNPAGEKAALRNLGLSTGREGLLHSMKRGVMEMAGFDHGGQGLVNARRFGSAGKNVSFGGGLFSSGGMREIMHDVKPTTGGFFNLGARRSLKGSLGKFAGKALGPAFFLYQASTEGIGVTTRDAVVFGAAFGAGRFALSRLGMGLLNPVTLGAAALVGGGIAARKALIAGREYNQSVRKASFGNPFSDSFGNAATLRQASLQAIQGSKINGRNSIGMEASLLHS